MKRFDLELRWGVIRSLRVRMGSALHKSLSTEARLALRLLEEQLPIEAVIPGMGIADTQVCKVHLEFTEPQVKCLLVALRSVHEIAAPFHKAIAN